jgi:AbiV family abortive infection protein
MPCLHFDSILLYKEKSFSSAFALSVIALEEFGKGFGIEETNWQAGHKDGFDTDDEEYLSTLLRNHKIKQARFASFFFALPKSVLKKVDRLQKEKNDALYVGVRLGNQQIARPSVSKLKAKTQIGLVNKLLLSSVHRSFRQPDDGSIFERFFRRTVLLTQLREAALKLA